MFEELMGSRTRSRILGLFFSHLDWGFFVREVDEGRLISGLNDLEKRLSWEINYVIFDSSEVENRLKENDPFVKKRDREIKDFPGR